MTYKLATARVRGALLSTRERFTSHNIFDEPTCLLLRRIQRRGGNFIRLRGLRRVTYRLFSGVNYQVLSSYHLPVTVAAISVRADRLVIFAGRPSFFADPAKS